MSDYTSLTFREKSECQVHMYFQIRFKQSLYCSNRRIYQADYILSFELIFEESEIKKEKKKIRACHIRVTESANRQMKTVKYFVLFFPLLFHYIVVAIESDKNKVLFINVIKNK